MNVVSTDPRLQRYSTQTLFERYRRDRATTDRDELVLRHRPLALHLSHRYPAGGEREDLEQVACLALIRAIERFDPSRGVAFSSFAVPTIAGELKRYFRDLGWAVRVPRSLQELAQRVNLAERELTRELGRSPTAQQLAERCDAAVEDVLEARSLGNAHRPDSLNVSPDPDDDAGERAVHYHERGYERAETSADVSALLAHLPARERQIFDLRFRQDLTQREIAERVDLSQMHVSRLIRTRIDQLRQIAASA